MVGLGIINPKAQCEALLAKLLMRGLSLRGEPWKGILRHKAKHGQPHISFHVVMPKDFTPLKFHKAPFTLWRGILGLLAKCAKGGEKIGPQLLSKVLRSPIFGNSHILNAIGLHLGINRISEGEALVATSYYSKVHHLWDAQTQSWKD